MDLTKYAVFSGYTTTGTIGVSSIYPTENAKSVRFWLAGPVNAGVGSSCTVWFEHAPSAGETFDVFPGVVLLGAAGGTISSLSLRNSVNIASSVGGSMAFGYVYPDNMPNCLKIKYELSGVAASASAGTISGWLSVGRDIVC